MHPDLQRFKVRLKLKYEIQHFMSLKNNNYNSFKKSGFFHLVCYLTKYKCVYMYK